MYVYVYVSNVDSYCYHGRMLLLDWFHIDYPISKVNKYRDGRNFIGVWVKIQLNL